MKWIKMTGLMAVVVSMLGLNAGQAAAQPPYTPTLSVTVTGNSATIQWTPVNEAQGYTIEAWSGPNALVGSLNVPASTTGGVLNGVPNGVYYLRVRAFAGPTPGPWSNVVQAVVPGTVDCTSGAALTAGAQVNGPVVNIGWSAVPGALGYQVEYSRYPGITELPQIVGAGTLEHQQYIPMLGTFYARVRTQTSCGQQAVSNEVEFTITDLSGGGQRAPDPAPGQLIPFPDYGYGVALQVAQQYPGDLANVCGNKTYLYKLVRELRKYDTRWGLNWKRGYVGSEVSRDVITYNPGAVPDNQAKRLYLVDVVSGICERNGFSWNWEETTDKTWDAGQAGLCGNEWCAAWTLDPYLAAGYPMFPH